MAGTSAGAQAGWETRWERAYELGDFEKLGPKGQDYIEQKYGEEVRGEEPPDDYYDEYEDPYDIEIEY